MPVHLLLVRELIADTAIIHDAGHTIFTGNNIYDGYTNINGGILTIASH
ncbi:TPA: hypothetical protein ACN6ZP_003752 [Escherichia albertii]